MKTWIRGESERQGCARAPRAAGAVNEAAEEAAFSGARFALEALPISGRIVIGAPEGADQLAVGTEIGFGGDEVDLALDPLEGRGSSRAAATTRSR